MKRLLNLRDGLFYLLIIALLIWTVATLSTRNNQEYVEYSQVVAWFQDEQVAAFSVSDSNVLTMQLQDGAIYRHALADLELFHGDLGQLILEQQQAGILAQFDYQQKYEMPLWLQITLPVVLSLAAVFLLWWIMAVRQQNAQNGGGGGQGGMSRFGKARTKVGGEEGGKKVTFADVAGADEEKAELQEVVEFLRDPKRFTALGARIPKGILLVGPPGTGKTLLAKAVAGEDGVKFLSISGSDFVELYVGVGASRVRDLFDQAKKEAPAIVFIDEIEAVTTSGNRRSINYWWKWTALPQTRGSSCWPPPTGRTSWTPPCCVPVGLTDRYTWAGRT